jgi:hypothetical protein
MGTGPDARRRRGNEAADMNELTLSDRLRWFVVTVVVAAAAVPLSFVLWRTPPGVATPPADVLPFLVPIGVVIPALSLGLGVAFMFFGSKIIRTNQPSALSRASFVSIWWLLVNWWPHANFHRVANGWANVLVIDYVFHTTVIIATCVVAVFFFSTLGDRQDTHLTKTGIRDFESTRTIERGS